MRLPFTKMHGAGNDFVVIDATCAPFTPAPALLRRLTDRHFGIGCDQVLVIGPPSAANVDFDYRIFNADGSEVGQCGNGSRCFARYVRDHRLSDKNPLRVRTLNSVLELHVEADGQVRVNMGVPQLEPAQVPMLAAARALHYPLTLASGERIECTVLSMGNPHAVMAVADVETAPVAAVGEALQHHAAFPERVNAGFMQIVDAGNIILRVYERGAGETLACGSGACAAVVAGRLWGRLSQQVNVRVRGGMLRVEWQGEGQPVWMTGPAETVFKGEIEWRS
ncbi:MAG: diaminopimelate epimerase [Stenotrophobium sp.]